MMAFLMDHSLHDTYAMAMRTGLFSGFMTVTGFLLTAHAFIVVHMKKEFYDQEFYRKRIEEARQLNKNHSYYGALSRLSKLLTFSVAMSLATAVSQFSVGLIHRNWAALICMALASITAFVLGVSIFIIRANLKQWFADIEQHHPRPAAST
jgi:hypothetical protein